MEGPGRMRPIKFRAWNQYGRKKMMTPCEGQLLADALLYTVYSYSLLGPRADAEDIVLMQFTGLYDKNKKEIYEGDILKDSGFGGNSLEVVRWVQSGWEPANSYLNWTRHILTAEVVGNIYENPELLKGQA